MQRLLLGLAAFALSSSVAFAQATCIEEPKVQRGLQLSVEFGHSGKPLNLRKFVEDRKLNLVELSEVKTAMASCFIKLQNSDQYEPAAAVASAAGVVGEMRESLIYSAGMILADAYNKLVSDYNELAKRYVELDDKARRQQQLPAFRHPQPVRCEALYTGASIAGRPVGQPIWQITCQ